MKKFLIIFSLVTTLFVTTASANCNPSFDQGVIAEDGIADKVEKIEGKVMVWFKTTLTGKTTIEKVKKHCKNLKFTFIKNKTYRVYGEAKVAVENLAQIDGIVGQEIDNAAFSIIDD